MVIPHMLLPTKTILMVCLTIQGTHNLSVSTYKYATLNIRVLNSYYWITQAFQSTSGSISNLVNGINTLKADSKMSRWCTLSISLWC